MDWADQKASEICGLSVCAGDPDHIARALRVAKAEGYVLGGAETASTMSEGLQAMMAGGEPPDFAELVIRFTTRAFEIERGLS